MKVKYGGYSFRLVRPVAVDHGIKGLPIPVPELEWIADGGYVQVWIELLARYLRRGLKMLDGTPKYQGYLRRLLRHMLQQSPPQPDEYKILADLLVFSEKHCSTRTLDEIMLCLEHYNALTPDHYEYVKDLAMRVQYIDNPYYDTIERSILVVSDNIRYMFRICFIYLARWARLQLEKLQAAGVTDKEQELYEFMAINLRIALLL